MFKIKCLAIIALLSSVAISGKSQALLNGPETIVYDSTYDRYLVSNMSTYNIVQIDRFGNYTIFNDQVKHPYGMTIMEDVLYVGGDRGSRGGITGIDLATGERVFELLSSSWYYCINGVTSDTSGNVYFACTGSSEVRRINVGEGTHEQVASIPIPNAVLFDASHNRLIVTTNNWGSSLYTVDLADNSVSTVPFRFGQFSGLTEDRLGNIYVAYFSGGTVYRIDGDLAGSIEEVSAGHNGPEGICFDRVHSVLCVPNLMANSVSIIPVENDIWIDCDATLGWAPFEVAFSGLLVFDITDWYWDIGDGDRLTIQTPTHTYGTPGLYEVALNAVTTGGDTLRQIHHQLIGCLADTLWADSVEIDAAGGSPVEVVVSIKNSIPVRQIQIPIVWSGNLGLVLDSFSTAGCRTEDFGGQSVVHSDPGSNKMTVRLSPRAYGSPLYMDPGEGPVLRLCFRVWGSTRDETSISFAGYPGYEPSFGGAEASYTPVTRDGVITYPTCCQGLSGNIDNDPADETDLSDLTRLIDYLFISFTEPDCIEEANVDGDLFGTVDLADLTKLIDYLFISFGPPAECL